MGKRVPEQEGAKNVENEEEKRRTKGKRLGG